MCSRSLQLQTEALQKQAEQQTEDLNLAIAKNREKKESNSKLKGHGLIEAVRSELGSDVTDNMVKRILDNSNNLGDNVLTVAHLGGSLRRIGEIIEAFIQFDANEDGQLSATEFEKLLEERGNDVTSTLVGEMMLNADMDHDGNLDLQVT